MRATGGQRRGIIGALGLAVVLGWGAPGMAHNQLIGSDPADGGSLGPAPAEVELTFLATVDSENVELAVTGPDGESAVSGEPEVDGTVVTMPVSAPLAGEYEIAYEVLSTDGHLVDGTLTFTVTEGQPPPSPTPSPSPTPGPTRTAAPLSPAAAAGEDSGGPAWWLWGLVAVGVAAGGYGGYRLLRRAS